MHPSSECISPTYHREPSCRCRKNFRLATVSMGSHECYSNVKERSKCHPSSSSPQRRRFAQTRQTSCGSNGSTQSAHCIRVPPRIHFFRRPPKMVTFVILWIGLTLAVMLGLTRKSGRRRIPRPRSLRLQFRDDDPRSLRSFSVDGELGYWGVEEYGGDGARDSEESLQPDSEISDLDLEEY